MPDVSLDRLLAPSFRSVHHDVWRRDHTHYWLHGGRGSTKSTFAALQVILAVLRDSNVNAVVIRKVKDTMRDSVYAQMLWALDALGVESRFKCSLSPMEMTLRHTGQQILFRGTDDPGKLKSLKVRAGYVGVVWFEELDQFHGMAEIRSILQSLARGGDHFTALYTYNPPRSRDSWANREAAVPRDDRLTHKSDYRDVPREWLGETFLAEAEELRRTDETAYRHEYLGEAVGTGGSVFENVEIREITAAEIETFDRVHCGVDFGWFPDPWTYGRAHYEPAQKALYLFDAEYATRLKVSEQVARIQTRPRSLILCDSASPETISAYRDAGLDARPARKGAGSREYGMKWLSSLSIIVIDPRRDPLAAVEFPAYEFERTRDGEYVSAYPDANDHSIDRTRYGMSSTIFARGQSL
ncbi:MAG: PBSX family phage terminase large subunit [Coriobacteriia bacterium]|nr:PBSX family phage terminase large subunit [Coriobacteriia bacterium]